MSSSQTSSLLLAVTATALAGAAAFFAYQKMQAQSSKPTTKVSSQVAQDLATFIADAAKQSIEERGVFYLAVAGGSLLDLIGKGVDTLKASGIDFSKVVIGFANHKCVASTDGKATLTKSKAKFADALGITQFVEPMAAPTAGSDGKAEAAYYAKALVTANLPHKHQYPVFDLVLLGLGGDGHVGSCHPMGPAVLETTASVAGSPKDGEPSSITLTIEAMNTARQVAVVATGKSKAEAVARAMIRPAESPRGTFPAQLLNKPVFFVDAESAANL